MSIKLFGAVLLTLAGFLAGFSKSMELRRKICILDDMDRALGIISAEIRFREMPLPELFCRLAESGPKLTRGFFETMRQSDIEDPCKLWTSAAEVLLKKGEAMDIVEALGQILGRYDVENQTREIERARSELAAVKEAEKSRGLQSVKNYPTLGLCAGAVAAILLI